MRKSFGGLAAALLWALAGCSGGGGSATTAQDSMGQSGAATPAAPAQTSVYTVNNLVSDGAVSAEHTDANLKNPWGIVFNALGPVWIADNGSNTSTLYILDGTKFPLTVQLPGGKNGEASPTGIVYNGDLTSFIVGQGLAIGGASFIFAGENGTIVAWGQVDPILNESFIEYDDGAGGAVYKGLALADNGGSAFLYATDFHNAKIDVFDSKFGKVSPQSGFVDPNLPAGYAPFGIQAVNGKLYVTYAQQSAPEDLFEMVGPGLGLVDLYDSSGNLLQRVANGGPLNAPWGIAMAPADFGQFSNDLLIGNFGDGAINAFDPATGAFIDSLRDAQGNPLQIPGLWGLAFGNGLFGQPPSSLFFAAGINGGADGLYGRIDPSTKAGS
jgi:uncharacterized protein (TIGR03118 family)